MRRDDDEVINQRSPKYRLLIQGVRIITIDLVATAV
jgi:hypothetical protein